jgi:hypothetical protein
VLPQTDKSTIDGSIVEPGPADKADQVAPLRRVCALDELDPSAEGDHIGLVVVAGGSTRIKAVDGARDLLTAAGWPLLGVVDEAKRQWSAR